MTDPNSSFTKKIKRNNFKNLIKCSWNDTSCPTVLIVLDECLIKVKMLKKPMMLVNVVMH